MGVIDWTEQERIDVLNFYRIDSLEPEQWPESAEQPTSPADEAETVAPTAAAQLMGMQDDELNMCNRMLIQDNADPLGINDSAYMNQLRLREVPEIGGEETDNKDSSKRSLSICSPHFHPRHFLRNVHRDTSFTDLIRGIQHLQQSCEQRNETVKSLVKQNFARFINAKNSVELVYQDMKQRGLTGDDHGLRETGAALQAAFQKAQEAFHPLLARRSHEELVRRRLRVYEKYSFVLALGGKFERYLALGDFQQASYDYRKAKALLAEVQQETALRRVLEKTWNGHFSKVLADLKEDLFKKLANPIYSYDVHSKLIEYLLELDAHPDPVAFYLESMKTHMLTQIKACRSRALDEITAVSEREGAGADVSFARLVEYGRSHAAESLMAGDDVFAHIWHIRKAYFGNISELFEGFAPAFSKFTSALFEGKFQAGGADAAASAAQDTSMVGDQTAVYIAKLRDMARELAEAMVSSAEAILANCPHENALVAAAFAPVCLHALQAVFVAADEAAMSDIMMERIKSSVLETSRLLVQRLWDDAIADAGRLPRHESWVVGTEGLDLASVLSSAFQDLVQQLISTTAALQRLFSVERFVQADMQMPGLGEVCPKGLCSMFQVFVDSLKTMAFADDEEARAVEETLSAASSGSERMDLSSVGTGYKLLIILTNIIAMQDSPLASLGSFFAAAGLGELGADCQQKVAEHLRLTYYHVSDLYVARRRGLLMETIQVGFDSFNWETSCPSGHTLRPYLDRLLAELTCIQNEILDVSASSLRPLMLITTKTIFKEFLAGIMRLPRLSLQGYLQARLELDFLTQCLITAITDETDELIQEIKRLLLELLGHRARPGPTVDMDIKARLEVLGAESSLQYKCFQYT